MLTLILQFSLAAAQDYQVGPKDVVSISVSDDENLTGRWTVRDDGKIEWSYVGPVQVGGLSVIETTESLRSVLTEYFRDPHLSVEVAEYRSQPVTLLGSVRKPGVYYLEGPTALRALLAQAEGFSSSVGEVRVEHADGSQEVAAVEDLFIGARDIPLHGGDVVLVPEGQFVFVGGEVEKPGAIPFQDGLTAAQALTRAGGPANTALLKGAYILRDGQRVALDLKRILSGREADVVLQPGDQLFLRESPI